MRVRGSIGVLLGAFVVAAIATAVIPGGTGGILAGIKLVALTTSVASGVWLVLLGIKAVRDRMLGRTRRGREMFPPGRCHACGYDTSGLLRGMVACPECGAILATIPGSDRAKGAPETANSGAGGAARVQSL